VVVLVTRAEQIARSDPSAAPDVVVRAAAGERFTPAVVSAAAGLLLAVVFLVSGGAAGLEVLEPAAVVVLGGLVTALLVGVAVMPGLLTLAGPTPTSRAALDVVALDGSGSPPGDGNGAGQVDSVVPTTAGQGG
jgi:Cu/Ag efflux pump CusA